MDIPLPLPARHGAGGVTAAVGYLGPCGLGRACVREGRFEEVVEWYRRRVRALAGDGAEAYLVEDMADMAEARAAVLAIGECAPGRRIAVSFLCDGDGRTGAQVDVLAALIVMQGMGASAFGLAGADGEGTAEQLRRLAPYASVPLLRRSSAGGGECWQAASLPGEVCRDPDVIPCASETEARFITPDVDVGEALECGPDLAEAILEAEEERPQGALKIAVLEEDDVDILAENQYVIRDALCLWSDVPELLERALRIYQGRAFWDGTGELERPFLEEMSRKYGLILL